MNRFYCLVVLIILLYSFNNKAEAQSVAYVPVDSSIVYDSLNIYPASATDITYIRAKRKIIPVKKLLQSLADSKAHNDMLEEANALLNLSDTYLAFGSNRAAYTSLISAIKIKDAFDDDWVVSHLYYNLAIVLCRLKDYTDAIKCFYRTGFLYQQTVFRRKRKQTFSMDTSNVAYPINVSEDSILDKDVARTIFTDSLIDATMSNRDTAQMMDNPLLEESPVADYKDIINAFRDNKHAFAYAVLVHIKQPIPGRKDIFVKLNRVGHTFITLVKFNSDSSVVTKSFGFYPVKGGFLTATPIIPSSASEIRNDSLHDWDEIIGKFISAGRFENILTFISGAAGKTYNLNHNNCTDFGLKIASLANITITDTKNHWPLGYGNNPATTGQSILRGKYRNEDTQSQHGLFACSNNLFIHHLFTKLSKTSVR
jgi:tetratricopeptide (TPR) repeat protein